MNSVTGIIPEFMQELDWAHTDLSELVILRDTRTMNRASLYLGYLPTGRRAAALECGATTCTLHASPVP